MNKDRKGRNLGSVQARIERDLIGQYPEWEKWRNSFIRRLANLGEESVNFDRDIGEAEKELLHEFYVLRRRIQIGSVSKEEFNKFDESLDEHGVFDEEDNYINPHFGRALNLITELTPSMKK